MRRFKNESKAISMLNHPNIVKVYDVSVTDQLQYIVMEYVDGITLKEYLNERGGSPDLERGRPLYHPDPQRWSTPTPTASSTGTSSPRTSCCWQRPAADDGLRHCPHLPGGEPDPDGDKAMGSVHYISPEQAKGDEPTPSDIYSVGVMMYEMLSGKLPFDGDMVQCPSPSCRSRKSPSRWRSWPPRCRWACVQITERAMAKLPVNRYYSAAEMLEALDAYVREPVHRVQLSLCKGRSS